ncbi:MAG: hypothetical protein AABX98_04130, partial [Nanoarchaeota archaeon]
IDEMVSEQEKKERIQKALEIHMLQNREAHAGPPGQTLFSFTQGDPNAMIGKIHQFGQAMDEEGKTQKKSIEQQQIEKQQQQWQSEQKHQAAPVRTCPCCVQFLQSTFHMSDKQANEFVGGAPGGSVGYGSNTASESYGSSGPSGEYSGNSGSGDYSSSSGGNYMSSKGSDKEEDRKYTGQKSGYES